MTTVSAYNSLGDRARKKPKTKHQNKNIKEEVISNANLHRQTYSGRNAEGELEEKATIRRVQRLETQSILALCSTKYITDVRYVFILGTIILIFCCAKRSEKHWSDTDRNVEHT